MRVSALIIEILAIPNRLNINSEDYLIYSNLGVGKRLFQVLLVLKYQLQKFT